jgi:hypothetical protein
MMAFSCADAVIIALVLNVSASMARGAGLALPRQHPGFA